MHIDYQRKVPDQIKEVREKIPGIQEILKKQFPNLSITQELRQKDLDRIAQKDVRDYHGTNSRETQVKDLFAGRLSFSKCDHDLNWNWNAQLTRILDQFTEYMLPLKHIIPYECNQKVVPIKVDNKEEKIRVVYLVFHKHIEIQILSAGDNIKLEMAHEQYEKDRVSYLV
jgi:hypothetical protein